MIRSFADSDTEKVWNLTVVKQFGNDIAQAARKKMQLLDTAENIIDLRIPPGNRPEKLNGSREGQHSVRVDDQWSFASHRPTAVPSKSS